MCYAYYAWFFFRCALLFGEFGNFFFIIIIIYRAYFRRGIVLCTLVSNDDVDGWEGEILLFWEREYNAVEKCVYAKKCANLFNVYEGCKEWGKLALKHTVSFSVNLCKETGTYSDGKWLLLRCFSFCRLQIWWVECLFSLALLLYLGEFIVLSTSLANNNFSDIHDNKTWSFVCFI